MTPKQRLFVKEYLVDLNATRAAILAGYSEKTAKQQGSRLLTNVDVKTEIGRLSEKTAEKLEISREFVLENIREVAERAKAQGDNGAAIKGYHLLGLHIGMWPRKIEHTGAIEHNYHDYGKASDEQLRAWEESLAPLEQVALDKG